MLPGRCAGCGASGVVLCPSCVAAASGPVRPPEAVSDLVAIGPYAGVLREAVLAFKFAGVVAVASVFADMLGALVEERGCDALCVVPAPTNPRRRRRRGFDQSEGLARALAIRLHFRYEPALVRDAGVASSRPQGELDAVARSALSPATFLLERVPVGDVLVVDDVVTTGATLSAARATLAAAGVRATIVAVAATQLRDDRCGS